MENDYIYEVFSGKVGWRFLRDCPPRKDGMGRQAIRDRKYKFIPDPSQGHSSLEMAKLNRQAFDAEIKALAAFPLQVNCEEKFLCQEEVIDREGVLCQEGVLYIDFQQEHIFKEEELRWAQLFANRAADAIRHATIYEQRRDREKLLTTLHSVAQSLAHIPKNKDLLRRIAWDTLNILAADIVTIYEYIQTEKRFITPADRAGRFKAEWKMSTNIQESAVPAKLVSEKDNVYSSLVKHQIFKGSKFAEQESIESVAGIQIKVGEEIVGAMFINYRRLHDFTSEEKKIIETLASSAAIAIKNQRWLTARSEIDRVIITTLDRDRLQNLIVEQAVKLTGADLGTIRLLDPNLSQKMLVTQAKYPKDAALDRSRKRTTINEGITGWVARNLKSALVYDVESNEWKQYYKACIPGVRSELCVPLLDKDVNLLGVLNVESDRTSAFDEKHQQMLEALADQVVIGIQNVENKDRLVKMEALATLGQLACFFTHKMNNEVGAIRRFARNLFNQVGSQDYKNILGKIVEIAEQIIQEVDRMKNFVQDKSHPTDLHQVIINACDSIKCPDNVTLERPRNPEILLQVLGKEQPLMMVFDNLFNNAFDAMPKGGTLSIQINTLELTEPHEKIWIEVQVSDTGGGIAKKHIGKIFQLGYTTKKATKGMGWGLWLTNYYVKSLGGYLTVDSNLYHGATFTVKLPIYKPKTERQI
jgi:signal transduction histidine kinase